MIRDSALFFFFCENVNIRSGTENQATSLSSIATSIPGTRNLLRQVQLALTTKLTPTYIVVGVPQK